MEWLLAHINEEIPPMAASGEASTSAEPAASSSDAASTTDTPPVEAKSLKCNDCGKLFKSTIEVEFHAAKTQHSNFSESTEEKKPLTEEEKKEQLIKLEEKLRRKRQEREDQEKQEELERERIRIKSGKDVTEARRRMEDLEMMKILEQRKREKAEEKAARERVKAQIELDKANRKAKMCGEPPESAAAPVPMVVSTTSSPTAAKDYKQARIQMRLPDGATLTQTFDAKETLSAVRLYIQLNSSHDNSFGMMTTFPRKVFTEEDYDKPLDILGN